ncbi:MAG: hypothetical protein A2469_00670 [Candidatus Magasanikbacteria bacterium RIFOXYC2_FULL_40_16]|uniref:PrgI family protein n=3 Tax=Candidatus Magasanikiibacteriota TaxID=1752731 RepID=A0A1F6NFQ3_9BACT|nr:MAG: hypothetical protein A2224_02375 [Candidatus Magasanikbacteria bacterium RIFOXYA2_FULL_40_20]OGH82690.1 MAG: hypothetical protein A2373_01200 [Candidatus Magasanikbacteria bacterium RIFOXYB1_FULL_40_15]OGH86734.1 MAG: hypothetical protein A2301_01000 [Candidatus Magasanikbacteria bacterium RIFOXYB2_FULL_40_13]OGH87713.1 MAG: hypothetical protein A2206_02395 [Candidatus Magasanikbacteria bacterium RIFOXYA1_FULL_40_8]OGH89295.1 MAG: hypothetical protein A2469_00670 [Candidatus Magasanikba
MQQFTVPQFIDVEDKILGPITIRQFLILLVGCIVIFISYRYGDLGTFVLVLAVVGILSLLFAFVKVNGQTFHYFLLNILQTTRKPSLRTWHKSYMNKELDILRKQDSDIKITEVVARKPVQRQHIRDLSLVVNTGGYYKAEE